MGMRIAMVMTQGRCMASSEKEKRFELRLAPGSRSRANMNASTTMRPVMRDSPTPKAQPESMVMMSLRKNAYLTANQMRGE